MEATRPAARRQILMDEAQAAHFVNLSPRTLESCRRKKKGPPYVKFGHEVRYKEEDLEAWINDLRILPETG